MTIPLLSYAPSSQNQRSTRAMKCPMKTPLGAIPLRMQWISRILMN